MSWSVNAIGSKAAVAKKVNDDASVPDAIKGVVNEFAVKLPETAVLLVETSGHVDFTGQPPWNPQGEARLTIKVLPKLE